MITLGINWGDSSTATIMENNKIVAAYGEERFSRIKNDMAQITIKIENSGLSGIFETFRRYGYAIISGHEDDSFLKTLKDRSAYLDRYLNL